MTPDKVTPEKVIATIERFPAYIQKQYLFDRMDLYLGHGVMPVGDNDWKHIHMDVPEEVEELLQFKLKIVRGCKSIPEIFCFIQKPDRLQILAFLAGVYTFDKVMYADLLRDCWIATEFPHQIKNDRLIWMFDQADRKLLMTDAERKAFNGLPEEIPVFRGLQDDRARRKALSWTTSYKVAEWFAHRWSRNGKVFAAVIRKSDVYMYTNQRNEFEVVVNPNHLRKIREMQECPA